MTKGKVLIADDELTFALATAELLRRQGYEVWVAESSADAGKLLGSAEPHVLIADIHMPGNDNLQFVQQAVASRPNLQVILATGYPTVQTAAEAVGLAAVAYLVKPFELKDLYDHVDQAVGQAKLFEAIQSSRERLANWTRDLETTSKAARVSAARARTAEDAFLMLSMGNVMAVLNDMKQVVDAHAAGDGEAIARQKLGCPPPITAVNALRDTIATLVRTKDAFRSRELGDLRKRLEAVLAGKVTDTAAGEPSSVVS